MAQGGGQAGGMGGSPTGASTGGTGSQSTPNMGVGMANSTNPTTAQNMTGGQQGGFGGFGGGASMGGYSGGYGGMGGYGGFGGQQQGEGQIPEFVSPFFQQMQQMRQQQPQLNQLGGGSAVPQNTTSNAAPQNIASSGSAAPQDTTGGFGFNAGNYMSTTGTPIPWYLQAENYNLPDAQKARVIAGVNSTGPTASMTGGMQGQPVAASKEAKQKNQNNKKQSELPTGTLDMLYSAYLDRAPDKEGLEYWNKKFGSTIDADEVAEFRNAATPELLANANKNNKKKPTLNNQKQPTLDNELTPEIARSLMQQSMKGGVKTSEFNKYGGYDKVSALYEQKGGDYSGKGNPYPQEQNKKEKDDKPKKKKDKVAKPVQAPKDLTDFSQMGKAGQFGGHGFAQGLQNYVGQQYGDYAYNPANQTFYKKGNKNSKGPTLEQMLQQGRAAGYKMASGGIASLRRKG